MSSDALFQLGMDLDHGSSTAQTEETGCSLRFLEPEMADERKDFSVSEMVCATRARIS